jgi:hypothetical protein
LGTIEDRLRAAEAEMIRMRQRLEQLEQERASERAGVENFLATAARQWQQQLQTSRTQQTQAMAGIQAATTAASEAAAQASSAAQSAPRVSIYTSCFLFIATIHFISLILFLVYLEQGGAPMAQQSRSRQAAPSFDDEPQEDMPQQRRGVPTSPPVGGTKGRQQQMQSSPPVGAAKGQKSPPARRGAPKAESKAKPPMNFGDSSSSSSSSSSEPPRDPNMPMTAKERVAAARALANKIKEDREQNGYEEPEEINTNANMPMSPPLPSAKGGARAAAAPAEYPSSPPVGVAGKSMAKKAAAPVSMITSDEDEAPPAAPAKRAVTVTAAAKKAAEAKAKAAESKAAVASSSLSSMAEKKAAVAAKAVVKAVPVAEPEDQDEQDENDDNNDDENVDPNDGAIGGGNGGLNGVSEFAEDGSTETAPCDTCGRNFALTTLPKHSKICKKTFNKKRKKFEIKRVEEEPESSGPKGGKGKKPAKKAPEKKKDEVPKWKRDRELLQAALRAGKEIEEAKKNGIDLKTLPPPPPVHDDRVPCPGCGRKFASDTAEKHIPKCAAKGGAAGGKAPAKRPALATRAR